MAGASPMRSGDPGARVAAGPGARCSPAFKPAGRDCNPGDAVAHTGKQHPRLGIQSATVLQEIVLERELEIFQRQPDRRDGLVDLMRSFLRRESLGHPCL